MAFVRTISSDGYKKWVTPIYFCYFMLLIFSVVILSKRIMVLQFLQLGNTGGSVPQS